jgi:hypothetical protein
MSAVISSDTRSAAVLSSSCIKDRSTPILLFSYRCLNQASICWSHSAAMASYVYRSTCFRPTACTSRYATALRLQSSMTDNTAAIDAS